MAAGRCEGFSGSQLFDAKHDAVTSSRTRAQ